MIKGLTDSLDHNSKQSSKLRPVSWLSCSCALSKPSSFVLFVSGLTHALLSGTTRCVRLVLYSPCPAPESAISPRSSSSFHWKMEFGNEDVALGVLVSTERRCSWTQLGNACVPPKPRVNTVRKRFCTRLHTRWETAQPCH